MSRYCVWRAPACAIRHGIFLVDHFPSPTGQCRLPCFLASGDVLLYPKLDPCERQPPLFVDSLSTTSSPDLNRECPEVPRSPSMTSPLPDTTLPLLVSWLPDNVSCLFCLSYKSLLCDCLTRGLFLPCLFLRVQFTYGRFFVFQEGCTRAIPRD
jgi:hypothetical protein